MITFLIVLYTGRIIDKWWKWGTDLYAAICAFIVLVLASIANGGDYSDWKLYCLALFNSFLVAASAGKLSDKSLDEINRKKEMKQKKTMVEANKVGAEKGLEEGNITG